MTVLSVHRTTFKGRKSAIELTESQIYNYEHVRLYFVLAPLRAWIFNPAILVHFATYQACLVSHQQNSLDTCTSLKCTKIV